MVYSPLIYTPRAYTPVLCHLLLLLEGVCRQLGIIQYHASVRPWEERHHTDDEAEPEGEVQESEENPSLSDRVIVPTIRVRLLRSVSILPLQSMPVQVEIEGSDGPCY